MLDFGLAKVLAPPEPAADTMTAAPATELGVVVGTIAYMSPEQAQGRPISDRSDIFSFGAVLYEMLAGRRPFGARTVASILTETPPPIGSVRKDMLPALDALIAACLDKTPARRPSARDVADRLKAIRGRLTAGRLDVRALLQRRAVVSSVGSRGCHGPRPWVVVVGGERARSLGANGGHSTNPPAERADDMYGAYMLATQARTVLPDDAQLAGLWNDVAFPATITTDPPGAEIAIRPYAAHDAAWYRVGQSPLKDVRVPAAMLRFRIVKAGYEPLEAGISPVGPPIAFALSPSNTAPAGMLRAAGGPATVRDRTVTLDDYWIDRFEVTNRQFKTFVDAGGYRTRSVLDRAVRVGHADALVGRSHGAVSRYHRPAGTRDVGARHLSGRPGGLPGRRRELVRSRGVRGLRRKELADRLSLVQRGRLSATFPTFSR